MKAFQSISSCNSALWKILFGHIILSGGTGTCSGLRFRMQRELLALVSPTISVKVRSPRPPVWGLPVLIPQIFLEYLWCARHVVRCLGRCWENLWLTF